MQKMTLVPIGAATAVTIVMAGRPRQRADQSLDRRVGGAHHLGPAVTYSASREPSRETAVA